ncbi:methyltransferase domain-containing protein [Aliarcobacter skirrowii]|uniref:class I SAM-dependent methyltransferase n=1 Tax=Aliarcobacter skirrowii TaxID=28200 RepID=UPI0032085063
MKNKIIEANIEVHTKMVEVYNQEPHFRPENQAKVRKQVEYLQKQIDAKKLLDIGCGTGFILNIAKDLFDELHGVDITQAMLDKVDVSSGNIKLYNALAQELPFEDKSFDMVTSYAFLHHLEDYKDVLKEAFRVLKPKGIYYIDLEPNKFFWEEISSLNTSNNKNTYSEIVQKEIDSILFTDQKVMQEFGIDARTVRNAEYIKSVLGGIDPFIFCAIAKEIGFLEVYFEYDWFLGQGTIMHKHSFEEASKINTYLKETLPLTKHLYKYIRFILKK